MRKLKSKRNTGIKAAGATLPLLFMVGTGWALVQNKATRHAAQGEFDLLPVEMRVLGQKSWFKGGPASARVVLVNHETGKPIHGDIQLSIQKVDGAARSGKTISVFSGETNAAGSVDCSFKVPSVPSGSYELTVSAQTDLGEQTLVEGLQIKQSEEVLFTCDKPVYQPEQTIHMRALGLDMAARTALSGLPVTFEVEDGRGNKVFKKSEKLSQFGVASADFTLADEVNMGTYTLRAVLPGSTTEKKVNVSRYALPRYKAAIKLNKAYYLPGESVTGSLSANYFFGKPVASAAVKLEATTPVIGLETVANLNGTTDSSGVYKFSFKLPDSFVGQPLEQGQGTVLLSATIKDTADHEQRVSSSAPVVKEPISILLVPEHRGLVPGVPNRVYASVATPDGAPISGAALRVDFGIATPGQIIKPISLVTDAMGLAVFEFLPNSPSISAAVHATDRDGHTATRQIVLADAPNTDQLLLRADKSLARVGDTIKLQAFSPSASGSLFLDVIRNKQTILTTTQQFVNGKAQVPLTLSPDMAGTLELHAYRLLPNEQIVRDTRTILVTAANDLSIDATLDAREYKPGGTANVDITVTDGQHHPVLAALGLSIVDESVFSLSENQPGLEKVYFNLEKELMTPRYEVHGLRPTFLLEPGPKPIPSRQLAASILLASAPAAAPYELNDNSYSRRLETIQAKLAERMSGAWTAIASAAAKYKKDRGEGLSGQDALNKLVENRYLSRSQVTDPWGTMYQITNEFGSMQYFQLTCAGPDRKWGTKDDFASAGAAGRFGGAFGGRGFRGGGFGGGGIAGGAMIAQGEARFRAPMGQPGLEVDRKVMMLDAVKMAAAPMMANRRTGAPEAPSAPRVREYFPETMYWNPALITDEHGKARISLPLADNITTWRLSMLGNTAGSMVGSATSAIKVFQDFFVELDMPVSLTQNDRVEIPVAVYNYLSTPQTVNIDLQAEPWFQLDGSARRTVHLAAGEVTAVHYPIKVVTIGRHTITATARGTRLSDAVRRTIDVTPDGKETVQVVNGNLASVTDKSILVPDDAIPGSTGMWLKIYPGSFSQLVEGLDGILQMPYGCFEQTSSTTYPNVLALQYLKAVKKASPEVQMKAEQFINIGYQRLVTFECKQGGFSWFGNEPAHQVLTAYGLLEFADMARVHEVDPAVISRTQRWLASRQHADGSWNETGPGIAEGIINRQTGSLRTTAYAAWALAESGYMGPQLASGYKYVMEHASEAKDPYTLAVMLNLAVKMDANSTFAAHCADQLIAMAVTSEKTAYWRSDMPTFTGGRGAGGDSETTGLAAYALVKWGRNSGFTNKVLAYLVEVKGASGTWQSTQGTVWSLKALVQASTGGIGGSGTLTVAANGKPATTITITENDSDVMRQIDLRPFMKSGSNTIHMEYRGKGSPQYQIVRRSYMPWSKDGGGAPPFAPLTIAVNYNKTTIAQNDTASVAVTIHNNTERIVDMPLVDIGVPPGFTVEPDKLDAMVKAGRISKFTLAGRQLIIYLEKLGPTETAEVGYTIRAQYPIKAKTPLSRVYPYYEPTKLAVSRPQVISVTK